MTFLLVSIIVLFNMKSYWVSFEQFEESLEGTATHQAKVLGHFMADKNQRAMDMVIGDVVRDHNIVGVYVYDAFDKIIAQAGLPTALVLDAPMVERAIFSDPQTRTEFAGRMKIAYQDTYIKQLSYERVVFELLVVMVVVLSLLLAVMIFNRCQIEAPLAKLIELINSPDISDDKFEVTSNDEISDVVNAFKDMRAREMEYSKALKRSKQNLEVKVQDRTKDLKRAIEKLEKASQTKDEFLSTMSHEIRTPMNGIIGLTELMLDHELDYETRRQAEMILSSSHMLLHILNDILDLSKLEASKYELQNEDFDLKELMTSVVHLFEENANQKQVSLTLDMNPCLPALWHGDMSRLRQVLVNLVSNATKFTQAGRVCIKVDIDGTHGSMHRVLFKVIDTGPGIPSNTQEQLFEKFTQLDGTHSRKYQGTGLGLAICKEIVTLMGGQIGVESELGQGSTFWFVLNLMPASDLPTISQTKDTITLEKAGEMLSVLVAEDNLVNQMVIKGILARKGIERVSIAQNGLEAVEMVKREHFDFILMDIQMPDMDGIAATKLIRELPNEKARTPIIALTANAMKGDKEKYLAVGIDDYLSKPIKRDELFEVIAQNL